MLKPEEGRDDEFHASLTAAPCFSANLYWRVVDLLPRRRVKFQDVGVAICYYCQAVVLAIRTAQHKLG